MDFPLIFNSWSHWIVGNIPGPCKMHLGETLSHYHVTMNERDVCMYEMMVNESRYEGT